MATSAPAPVTAQGLPTTGLWEVEPKHSSVGFRIIHHAVATFRTSFEQFEAQFDAGSGTFSGSVDVASVRAFDLLKDKLLSDEFFDAENYSEMRFVSTTIERSANRIAVDGDLTIKDQTRPVRVAGVVLGTAPVFHFMTKTTHEHFGVDLELTIDRRDFGLTFNNPLPNGMLNLGSHVTIELGLEFFNTEAIAES